jgi:hypothetical protein
MRYPHTSTLLYVHGGAHMGYEYSSKAKQLENSLSVLSSELLLFKAPPSPSPSPSPSPAPSPSASSSPTLCLSLSPSSSSSQAAMLDTLQVEDIASGSFARKLADQQLGPILSAMGVEEDPLTFLTDLVKVG